MSILSKLSDFTRSIVSTTGAAIVGASAGVLLMRTYEQMEERLTATQKADQLKSIGAWMMKLAERKHESTPMCQSEGCTHYGRGYMLQDEVWKLATKNDDKIHYLCLSCVVRRIGRLLVMKDFTDAPINDVLRQSVFAVSMMVGQCDRPASIVPPGVGSGSITEPVRRAAIARMQKLQQEQIAARPAPPFWPGMIPGDEG